MQNKLVRVAIGTMALVLLAAACGSSEPSAASQSTAVGVTQPTPQATAASTTTTVVTTTTASSTTVLASTGPPRTTTTLSAEDELWDAIPGWSGIEWGQVRSINFEPALKFIAPDGWNINCLPSPEVFGMGLSPDLGPPPKLMFLRLNFGTAQETADRLIGMAATATEPVPTEVGGAQTLSFDAFTPDEDPGFFFSNLTSCDIGFRVGDVWRFWIIDVGGETVTVAAYSDFDDFDDFAAEAQTVIDSVVWKDLDS